MKISKKDLAKKIDHTLLSANASSKDILKVCNEAIKYNFASVCVNSYYTCSVKKALKNTDVKTCIVVGFPLGACHSSIKAKETQYSIDNGAEEIDMVINISALKNRDIDYVLKDIKSVTKLCINNIISKVIIETCYLSKDEIELACRLAIEAGCDYVKTSTGFGPSGAKVEDIKIMKKVCKESTLIKAAGGIRTLKDATLMLKAGADRLGMSSSVSVIEEIQS